MCGHCGTIKGKVACASGALGVLSMLLAVVSRLWHFSPMGLGPRSFAVGSALLLLMSINMHSCRCSCGSTCDSEEHKA